jgi:hypothetical protein
MGRTTQIRKRGEEAEEEEPDLTKMTVVTETVDEGVKVYVQISRWCRYSSTEKEARE